MNSKFFFIVAIFLFLVPAIVSTGSNSNNTTSQTKAGNDHDFTAPDDQHHNSIPWSLELPNNFNQNAGGNHNSDEDGKSHYFHFNRYQKRRCRALACFVAKIILLITHLCSLLSGFVHITH